MPKKIPEKSAIEVRRLLSSPGRHNVGGVVGLYLQVTAGGSGSWILRVTVGNFRREIGLGGYPDVSLAEARERAKVLRGQIRQGIDPIEARKAAQAELRASQMRKLSFSQAAVQCHKKMSAEFKNLKHSKQWINSLRTYAFPVIGRMSVDEINMHDVLAVLKPIWETKTETASRVRMRLEAVFTWCTVSGYRHADNPARWQGHLDAVLPSPAKLKKKKGDGHHAAMPYKEVPKFMEYLKKSRSMSSAALQFLTLTGARSGEVRDAVWSEINIKQQVWIIPAGRMKAGREHRVPLSDSAIELLKGLPRFINTDLVFPSPQKKAPLTSAGIAKPLKRYNAKYTVHGMRSAFRTWISEETDCQNIVGEMALAHSIGDRTEAAYRRGDLFEKRRELMRAWSEFCSSYTGGQVVKIKK